MKKKVMVLQIGLGGKEFSGVGNWLYEHYKQINHEKVHFDFLFCTENFLALKQNTEVLADSKIFPLNLSNATNSKVIQYILFYKELNRFLKNNRYDVIHVNSGSFPLQTIAAIVSKKRRIKIHIAHSHSAHNKKSGKKQIILNLISPICQKLIVKNSEYLFACSDAAGEYLFGKRANYKLLANGIELNRYKYNEDVRDKIRSNEMINADNTVYCFVGRLAESKNLLFLVDVFHELHKNDLKSFLWLIGAGDMKEKILERVRTYNLNESVKLWGERNDVSDILQAADVFLFTSLFEGLSLGVIEAQASGVPVFASDSISPEHRVTDLMHFYSLDNSAQSWAEWIQKKMNEREKRKDTSKFISEAGYDITKTAKWLEEFYREKVEC